jgi:hypothetical protein
MAERIQWKVEKRKVSDLKPYEKNPRIITEYGLKELKGSLDHIGYAQPININRDNTILSGHARSMVLKEEDPNQLVDVYVPMRDLTPKEEEAVIIRMNKNVAGTWDFNVLESEFLIDDLTEWGFDEKEFAVKVDSAENSEIDVDNFGNDLEHTCPKCGFEFNE